MEIPNAIVVLSGGIKQNADGRWLSTDLNAEDDKLGAPGGKLRIYATAVLATKYPTTAVITTGGRGYDIPKDYSENRPMLAEILKAELLESGVEEGRILLETNSNTTYQQLQEIEKTCAGNKWRSVMFVTNRYHVPRLRAMVETKFPTIAGLADFVSAEDVLQEADPIRWRDMIEREYAGAYMTERVAKERQGEQQIRNGTYQFR
jgi:uncharacterized SAM-binding protein YcdF (DUF218 family)